jgi:3-hydroxyacyl-CoA dehydrogenase/enoyl-CoA hydratase/3-hydroxybutyryl-CoA epimerase
MSGIHYKKDKNGIVTLLIDSAGNINKIDREFITELSKAISELEKNCGDIKGVVITSAKSSFIAGADLKLLLSANKKNAPEFFAFITEFKLLLRRLEKLGRPIVAAINGTTIGGGVEFSLACHYRIAMDSPSIQIGLPETSLGLLPGGGGTVRLIHLLGAEKAIDYILSAKLLAPEDAKKIGLINELAKDQSDLIEKAKIWIDNNPHAQQPWDTTGHKIPEGDINDPKIAIYIASTGTKTLKKMYWTCPAIKETLSVATQALTIHFDAAQNVETRGLIKLLLTKEAKNMINTFFFQLNNINNAKSRPSNIPTFSVKKIGILGAGMMGCGIAVASAKHGIEVILKDINYSTAQAGKERCSKILEKFPNKMGILNHIHPANDPHDLQGCDLIIEAVFENVDIKAAVTKEAEPYLSNEGIIASNTSTLPISLLANATQNPENFIGIHFFSPAERMRLIEIIVGKKTSKAAIAKAYDFALQIHKTPIIANDSRGFYTSRVFGTYIDEGARLLEEGIYPAEIDNVAKLAGYLVGPLAITDEVSQRLLISAAKTNAQLDTIYGKANAMNGEACTRVAKRLYEEFNRGGRAYNGGFYEYPNNNKKYLWPGLISLYYKPSAHVPINDIKDRLLFRQAIETVYCYQEKVITSAGEANIGSVYGIGFPRQTGGTLQFINTYGLDKFCKRANFLAEKYGERFNPPALLKDMAAKGQLFTDNSK